MREFNTSGPNIPKQHYTIFREELIRAGINLVRNERYFTIWAPRQTGKSTYFGQLAKELEKQGYKTAHINIENFLSATEVSFIDFFCSEWNSFFDDNLDADSFSVLFKKIKDRNNHKYVFIVDEIEGLNPEIFGQFLHTIRNLYHSRTTHCLKSVILVGVSNIVGAVEDNASPFNIADNMNVPYFTDKEVFELLGQHEKETRLGGQAGQIFEEKVKFEICRITANQPGLVNGFAQKLVTDFTGQKIINYENYLKVEDWYLRIAIDKNFANILNKAQEERSFVERLLFTEEKIPFTIDRPAIKLLHTNGLIKDDGEGFVTFWVPFYRKRLYDAFYPYSNGEKTGILRSIVTGELFDKNNRFNHNRLISGYKEYVKRRGFNVFREKNKDGSYTSIKESALIYSFETYIQAFLQVVEGKSYREADTGLGKSDLIINVRGNEYLVESKIYYYENQFLKGKKQLAYYCKSLGLKQGIYLVFCTNYISYPESVKEKSEKIEKVDIHTYLVEYDENKWE
ncbi:MAG: AAA-like domain-containing protein [Bacteroidetes bacterium]|nr:AAA-like domain-containing protein [Bacteroidota bacterium]